MQNFNHSVLLWIALWALIHAALIVLLVYLLSKIKGKLLYQMFTQAEFIAFVVAILVAVHFFWAKHEGVWIIFGILVGSFLGQISRWVFPKPQNWEEEPVDY